MNQVLAVCDSEIAYAYQLVDYLGNKKNFPFQVQLFSSEKTLIEYSLHHPIAVILISQKDYYQQTIEMVTDHVVVLRENFEDDLADLKTIYKYQSMELIVKELLEWVAKRGNLTRVISDGKSMKLIGVYSPVGKCLKTSFSIVMGQLLSKKHKVLYINMESYSGLGKLLQKDFKTDMSELIYYLQNSKEKFIYHMGSMTGRVGELDLLPPFHSFLDFISVSKDEWIQLFQEIERGTDYEYIILDLSDAIQGLYDILRLCDLVYTLGREDGFSMAKIEQYEDVLKKSNYEDVWKKTKCYTIPEIKNLPLGLPQLTFTELAEYVKDCIREDFE